MEGHQGAGIAAQVWTHDVAWLCRRLQLSRTARVHLLKRQSQSRLGISGELRTITLQREPDRRLDENAVTGTRFRAAPIPCPRHAGRTESTPVAEADTPAIMQDCAGSPKRAGHSQIEHCHHA